MTAGLYATARLSIDRENWRTRDVLWCAALLSLALLAKPVAAVAIVPVLFLIGERAYSGRTFRAIAAIALISLPLILLWLYDRAVGSHAEWHWASGILGLHVLPALRASLQNGAAFAAKAAQFRVMLGAMAYLMIGPAISGAALLGLFFPPATIRSRSLLWSWLAAGLLYIFVVVTVERVDYYTFPLLPLAALTAAGVVQRLFSAIASSVIPVAAKYACAGLALAAFTAMVFQNREIVKPYYHYSKSVYRNAIALDRALPAAALVVMGHYDPSVLYYIGRFGWEEDPYLWTPFDEQSAIRKGARYFIAIERNRFYRNLELCAWMQRFPLLRSGAQWPVYVTDPAQVKPEAERQWRAFRNAEKSGRGRHWLSSHGVCSSV